MLVRIDPLAVVRRHAWELTRLSISLSSEAPGSHDPAGRAGRRVSLALADHVYVLEKGRRAIRRAAAAFARRHRASTSALGGDGTEALTASIISGVPRFIDGDTSQVSAVKVRLEGMTSRNVLRRDQIAPPDRDLRWAPEPLELVARETNVSIARHASGASVRLRGQPKRRAARSQPSRSVCTSRINNRSRGNSSGTE
jgi:hypothetical protein